MKAEIRRLKRALEKKDQSRVADSGVSSESGMMVDCFYKAVSLDANHLARFNPNTTASGLRRVPSEVAAFFQPISRTDRLEDTFLTFRDDAVLHINIFID